jgi:FKBP-type peptidyl-prolyl cis-trans isomerase FkpA
MLRMITSAALMVALVGGAQAADPQTEDQKTLYALGLALSRNLATFELTQEELGFVTQGMEDGVLKKEAKVDSQAYQPKIQAFARDRQASAAVKEKAAGQEYLAKAEKEKGVEKLPSGLIYKETQAGTGKQPATTDRVKVHYNGTLTDGTVFDSSIQRGQPATFPLNGVIKCWTEGVQKMKVGGKARLVCPPDIAYGDRGAPPLIKPGATLVFDVELLEIVEAPPKPSPAAGGAAAAASPAAK